MDNTIKKAFAAAVAAAALVSLQTGCAPGGSQKEAESPLVKKLLIGKEKSPSCKTSRLPYKLGIARYTMYNTPFDRVLDIAEALDCHYLSLIEGTIARDATDAQIAEYKERLAARGIVVDTLGPVYYDDEKTVEDAFSFAEREFRPGAFDYVFTDLWLDVSDGLELSERMKRLEERMPDARYAYWIEKRMDCYRMDSI